MEEKSYRLDRSKISAMTFSEADNHINYWATRTADERLNAACFIINNIFNVTPQTKVDRSVVDKRKHS